jgi:hypothetical protein
MHFEIRDVEVLKTGKPKRKLLHQEADPTKKKRKKRQPMILDMKEVDEALDSL